MNLPNKITLTRLLLIPIFVFFYLASFIPYGKLVAVIVFAAACFTDFLDGKIARKYNLVTDLGKFLDAIADKILVMSGLLLLVAVPVEPNIGLSAVGEVSKLAEPAIFPTYIGVVAAIVILAREFIVSAFRQVAAAKGLVLAADIYGKIKAVFQFITLIFYFVYVFVIEEFYNAALQGWLTANTVLSIVGYVLLATTVILTIVSGLKYILNNKQVLKNEK